jgi:hypothetical protein
MHPLIDGDGSCTLIYDLERAAVLEVPPELQLHVAPALETGDLDDDLLSWLVKEDLLTDESWAGCAGEPDGCDTRWWSLTSIHRFDGEVHARIGPGEGDVTETLRSVFKQSLGVSRVQLLLDWDGAFPGTALVERVLVEAERMAARAPQDVSFELVLDACQVTRPVAVFLAGSPLHLRVRCGAFPAPDASPAERRAWEASSSSLLLVEMAERTTVQCLLGADARLLDLWSWAHRAGVRHLDAVRGEVSPVEDAPPLASRAREYRTDLLTVCNEMAAALGARRVPIDYRPLTRMVRRLMGSEAPFGPSAGVEPGWEPDGLAGSDQWAGTDETGPLLEEAGTDALAGVPHDPDSSPCRACWARAVCNHSSLLAVPVDGDLLEPSPERCPLWLAEAEVALRLYHRLAQCDPLDVRRLLGDAARTPLDRFGRREEMEIPKQPF